MQATTKTINTTMPIAMQALLELLLDKKLITAVEYEEKVSLLNDRMKWNI